MNKLRMQPFVAMLLLVCGHLWAQRPSWFDMHSHQNYPPALYLLGTGTADGTNALERAKQHAVDELESRIRALLKEEIKNVVERYQIKQNEAIYSDFPSQSRTMGNKALSAIAIVETQIDSTSRTAYALAALDRKAYAAELAAEINIASKQALSLRNAADEHLKRGKLIEALHDCSEARRLIIGALPMLALHDAVASVAYLPPHTMTPVTLTSGMEAILSKIRVEKLDGDAQSGKIGTRFGVPMTVRIYYDTIPLSATALRFESKDDRILLESVTDDKGEASYQGFIRSLPGNMVRVRPDLGKITEEFEWITLSTAGFFTYTPQTSEIGIEIAVTGAQGMAAENVKGRLTAVLGTIGYRVVPSSRFRLEVDVQAKPAMTTPGFNGTIYSVQIEAVATLIDKQMDASLGTVSISAVGGGRSESDALAKASSNMTPDGMKLGDLIEKIRL